MAGGKRQRRDPAAVADFVERFSSSLFDQGFPRMPARVFVALLAADSGQLTAAELSEQLQISPAAVSGAVHYLMQTNLVGRTREPGARRDLYRMPDDVWYEVMRSRDQMFTQFDSALQGGIDALGPETSAGRRVEETRAFFEFMSRESYPMFERWRVERDRIRRRRSRRI